MLDERFKEFLRVLRQLQMSIKMVAFRFPLVWGNQEHRLTAEREAVFDENGAIAQSDAQRKERRPLESQHRFVPVIAVDRVSPDAPESDCDAVRQCVGPTAIESAQHVKRVDDGMFRLRFERQADKPGEHRARLPPFCEQARADQTAPARRTLVKRLIGQLE